MISYSDLSAAEMADKIKENMNAFRNGMADSIDRESLQGYAEKMDGMISVLESKDVSGDYGSAIEAYKEHLSELREFMNSGDDPAEARYIGSNAVSAFFAKLGDKLGIG